MAMAALSASLFYSCDTGIRPDGDSGYDIIPYPQEIRYDEGSLVLGREVSVAYPEELASEASMLEEYLKEDFGITARCRENKTRGKIVLRLDDALDSVAGQYGIRIGRNIEILSASGEGIFYGIQTLRQIAVRDSLSGRICVRRGEIRDWPAFPWRAFMLDDARNFRGMENVRIFLDEMARVKMNVFHWHLTDDQGWRIEIRKYPLLTEVGGRRDSTHVGGWNSREYDPHPQEGFYTQEQIREILEYAARRHITVMPEIEMPGHSSAAIAAYPWLGTVGKPFRTPCRFGYAADLFDVSRPEVISFLHDVLDEVMELFPSQVIHIGGDEVSFDMWKRSATVAKYMKEHGILSLSDFQIDFTNRISEYIVSRGRKMMGWSDIGLNPHERADGVTGEDAGKLAEGTVIQFWKGDPAQIRDVAARGFEIVNSYNMGTYLDYNYGWIPLKNAYNFYPVPENMPDDLRNRIIGLGCQLWTEWIMTDERMFYQAFPRFAALAEAGWTLPGNKDYGRFKEKALPRLLKIWDDKGINYGPTDDPE